MIIWLSFIRVIHALFFFLRWHQYKKSPSLAQGDFTIVIPIKRCSLETNECVARIVALTKCKIILCFEDEGEDDVYRKYLLKAITDKHDADWLGGRIEVLVGFDDSYRNPKVGNMAKSWDHIQTNHVIYFDCNVWIEPNTMDDIIMKFVEGHNFVSAPIPVRNGHPLEEAFLNAFQVPWLYVADFMGMHYAIGKLLAFKKSEFTDLHEIDGVAEDCVMTKFASNNNRSLALLDRPLWHVSSAKTWKEVADRQLRWYYSRKKEYPHIWAIELFSSVIVQACLIAGFDGLWVHGVLYLILSYALEEVICSKMKSPHNWLFFVLRDLLIPYMWVRSIFMRSVKWQGKEFK